jgi:hypothetical protein
MYCKGRNLCRILLRALTASELLKDELCLDFYIHILWFIFARGSVNGRGTMPQTGKSLVRFPIGSLDFLFQFS